MRCDSPSPSGAGSQALDLAPRPVSNDPNQGGSGPCARSLERKTLDEVVFMYPRDRWPSRNGELDVTVDALRAFPVLAPRRDWLLDLLGREPADQAALVSLAESDVGLVLSLLVLANRAVPTRAEGIASVRAAVAALATSDVLRVVRNAPVFDFFATATPPSTSERFAIHAATVQRLAVRVGREIGAPSLEDLASAALLHDIGKLALPEALQAEAEYSKTPEQ